MLNRDDQGRLRKKFMVLKIERWIGHAIRHCLEQKNPPGKIYDSASVPEADGFYEIDISTKNPLHLQSRFEQYELTI